MESIKQKKTKNNLVSPIYKDNNKITVVGAKEHNLKNITVTIPKNTLTVITGPSGSGKSSLALDVLFTEGKRRYMESLSSYARQFLGVAKKPDVDRIDGLCPSIAIEQKTVGHNPRSTVGTITEIYDYIRVLYARVGTVHCPDCSSPIVAQSPEKITRMICESFSGKSIVLASPICRDKKGEFVNELLELFKKNYYRFIIDGQQYKFKSEDDIKDLKLKKTFKHTIDLIIDKIEVSPEDQSRLQEAIERSFALSNGLCKIIIDDSEYLYSSHHMCLVCAQSMPEVEPRIFSFNSPIGACKQCHGLGTIHEWPWAQDDPESWKSKYPEHFGRYAQQHTCKSCLGKRLNKYALAVKVGQHDIYDLCNFSIQDLRTFFDTVLLDDVQQEIAGPLLQEIRNRIDFLYNVGLGYLSLNRSARTLSGGEGQRIRLATQIGSALSGVLYVLDEPSIGLHQRDNDKLIDTLKMLRDQGNTVVVVEHDIDTMRVADHIIDMGPAAGVLGGQITAIGTPEELSNNIKSLTGDYMSGRKNIKKLEPLRTPTGSIMIEDANKNNLRSLNVSFPLGVLCGVSGVSGSGKSTLVMQELVPIVTQELTGPARFGNKNNLSLGIANMVVIDQSPIGRTPRSNPATYLGVFDTIRSLYASLPESNARGYKVGRFSFNVRDGRCFECDGDGEVKVTMHFLPDVTMQCKVCKGKRYNAQTLEITYKNKNIADILEMTAYEALHFFESHPLITKRLQLLCDVGLDYITLGQSSLTLSGGEAQRIKLVDELAKRGRDTLYILDEPTTGLHSSDIERLLVVLNTLVDKGNSMIVIEHNLDVLKTVDYLIDLGPEGGDGGGYIVAQGTPHEVAQVDNSHTGRYLKPLLN